MDDELINFDEFDNSSGSANEMTAAEHDSFDDILNNDFSTGASGTGNSDFLSDYLYKHNIDTDNIKIVNADGEVETQRFDDLTDDEKYSIMNGTDEIPLSNAEINTINLLRDNNLDLKSYTTFVQNQAIEDFIQSQQPPHVYQIDDMTDEELIAADIASRYEDMNEDEIAQQVESIMSNESIAQKTISNLRRHYKELEDTYLAQEEAEKQAEQEQMYVAQKNEIARSLVDTAHQIDAIGEFYLDDQDKVEILSCLCDTDINGTSAFSKMMENPRNLFAAAWFLLKGEEAFNMMNAYYSKAQRNDAKSVSRSSRKEEDSFGLNEYFK